MDRRNEKSLGFNEEGDWIESFEERRRSQPVVFEADRLDSAAIGRGEN